MRTLLALLAVALLSGCYAGSYSHDTHTLAPTGSSGGVEGRPTLGMPQPIPGQHTILIPFAVESTKGLFEKDDPYAAGGVSQYAARKSLATYDRYTGLGGSVRWHNAILRDLKTGEEWTILDRRGVIGQWQVLAIPPKPDQPLVSRALLFIAVTDDTNHDGALDDRDARIAILTDADGRHPRAISPPAAQVWSADYDPANDLVYLKVVTDTSGDGKFTFDDIVVPYAAGLSDKSATPVVSEESRRRVESLLK
jgi:hypothetical protein